MDKTIKLISGNSNKKLAEEIAKNLKLKLADCIVSKFSDSETQIQINESIRGADAFVIQSTCNPVNDNLMELLLLVDSLKRAPATKPITAVIPYFGYGRQDRKAHPREPISAKLVANLIETSGVDRVLTLDLHSAQIQGFFNIPVDNLTAVNLFAKDLLARKKKHLVVVSPDIGGTARARSLAKRVNEPLAIIEKRRIAADKSEVLNVIGEVDGRTAVLMDDIIDTAGTICNAAKTLMEHGAREVYVYCSHGVFSGDAIKDVSESPITELVITDSIPLNEKAGTLPKIRQISIAELLSEAIRRTHMNESVSELFEFK